MTGIDDLLAGNRTIGLDRAGRVTTVAGRNWSEQYAYDQAGNMTAASWPAPPSAPATSWLDTDAQGQREVTGTLIRRAGNIRYRHDPQGRVTQRQRTRISRKPDTWHYEWDPDDRLTSVTTPDGTSWRYKYDPFGRRITKEHLSLNGNVTERTDFTWDGPVLVEQAATLAEADQQSVLTWNYQPGTFTPLTQTEHESLRDAPQTEIDQRFYAIITDLVGTPTELTAPDGTVSGHQLQTLWGGTTWTSSGAQTPIRFPGQYEDPETGLHYNNQRYYDPVTGGYLTADPLGVSAAFNPHTYVPNPHSLVDPLGLAPESEGCGESRWTPDENYSPEKVEERSGERKGRYYSNTRFFQDVPKEVHETVRQIQVGGRDPRPNDNQPDGIDRYLLQPRTPQRYHRWVDSTIYTGVGSRTSTVRVLVDSGGNVGYIVNHNYNQVFNYPWAKLPNGYVPRP